MKINFQPQYNNHTNFGMSYRITDSAKKLIYRKKMSEKHANIIKGALQDLSNLDKVIVFFDDYNGKLGAAICSHEGFLMVVREKDYFPFFKKKPSHFIKKISEKASLIEKMLISRKVKLIK